MLDKDKFLLLSILEAVNKIIEYSKVYSSADEFYQIQRDFDAAMMNFIIIGEMVSRLSLSFIEKHKNID